MNNKIYVKFIRVYYFLLDCVVFDKKKNNLFF